MSKISVSLVSGLDELMACFAIRSAAFLGRGEPYEEEFDGNDFCSATHLLARDADGKPVGTMRVRVIKASGVAVWERLSILPSARHGARVLHALAQAAKAYSSFKEVKTVLGTVADERLIAFWKRFGFEEMDEPTSLYNGVEYRPIRLSIASENPSKPNAMTAAISQSEPSTFHSLEVA